MSHRLKVIGFVALKSSIAIITISYIFCGWSVLPWQVILASLFAVLLLPSRIWSWYMSYFNKYNTFFKNLWLFALNWAYLVIIFIPLLFDRPAGVTSNLVLANNFDAAVDVLYFGDHLLTPGLQMYLVLAAYILALGVADVTIIQHHSRLSGTPCTDQKMSTFNIKTSKSMIDFAFTVSAILITFILVIYAVTFSESPKLELDSFTSGFGLSVLPLMGALHYLDSKIY